MPSQIAQPQMASPAEPLQQSYYQQPPAAPQQQAIQQPAQQPPLQAFQPLQAVAPVAPTAYPATSILGLEVQSTAFWTGALIGVGITLLVTSETLQRTVVKSVSKLSLAAQSGVEEIKEKFEDAKAEADSEMETETTD